MVTSSELSVTTGIPYIGTLISWTKSGFLKIIFLLKVKKESNYFKLLNHSNINSNFQIASHHWLRINLTMVIRRIWDWSNNGCWSSMSNNGYSWSSSVWNSSWGSCYSCCDNSRWASLKGISTVALFAVTRRPLIGYNTNWIMPTNTWTRVLTLIIKAC